MLLFLTQQRQLVDRLGRIGNDRREHVLIVRKHPLNRLGREQVFGIFKRNRNSVCGFLNLESQIEFCRIVLNIDWDEPDSVNG